MKNYNRRWNTLYPQSSVPAKEALKKVASGGQASRNQMKKRSLQDVNEHFESDFNTA